MVIGNVFYCMDTEICDRCNKQFVPKEHNEIWSSQTWEEPSSLIEYQCDECIADMERYFKEEEDKYMHDLHDDEDQHNTFKDQFHIW